MDQTKRLKVFFVLGSFKLGGTERTCSRIGMELLKRGFDVKFLLLNGVFDYKDQPLRENAIVLVEDKNKNKILRLASAYLKFIRILRKERPDFLISFSMGFNLFAFFSFYRKLIFRIESNIFIYKKKLYRRYFQKLVALSPNVKHVVIPSKGLYDRSKEYFYNPAKLVLVPNPIEVEEIKTLAAASLDDFPMLVDGKFLVTAGRLHASKGFAQLIRVFGKSKLHDFKLVILGEGPQRSELEQLTSDLNIKDRVLLPGYHANPYRFFARARYFILNSAHESFGNVLIEAMACGTPVVSNDCDFGPRSIITHNVSGVLYNRDKEGELQKVMEQVAFDDAFYDAIRSGISAELSRFNTQKIVDFWSENVLI